MSRAPFILIFLLSASTFFLSACNEDSPATTPTEPIVQNSEWEIFSIRNSRLPHDMISSIVIDKEGRKWIGTYGNGLAMFDGVDWIVYQQIQPSLAIKYINTMAIDIFEVLWIGTDGNGLLRFDGISWEVLNTDNSELVDNYITALTVDYLGNKWIGTKTGLVSNIGNNWYIYNTENTNMSDDNITAIDIDALGNKWIGTDSGTLMKFDSNMWKIFDENNSRILSERINTIKIDGWSNIWVGTNAGFAKYDNISWTEFPLNGYTIDGPVQCITVDGQKIWIGTRYDPDLSQYRGGLVLYCDGQWQIFYKNNSGLPDNDIRVIEIDSENRLWIGTRYGGIGVLNQNQ